MGNSVFILPAKSPAQLSSLLEVSVPAFKYSRLWNVLEGSISLGHFLNAVGLATHVQRDNAPRKPPDSKPG